MSPVAIILLGLVAIMVGLLALSALRNPILLAVSLRNVTRRKGSTLLVIAGSMVGTAMIAGTIAVSLRAIRLPKSVDSFT